MYFEWVGATDKVKLRQWDEFISNSLRGHYFQLSTWLSSFCVYGFDFRILIAREEEEAGPIIGGIGLWRFGNRHFGIMSSPIGPIVEIGFENTVEPILIEVLRYAASRGVFLLQLQFPYSKEVVMPATLPAIKLPNHYKMLEGLVFIAGNAPNEMNWIEFSKDAEGESFREQMLQRFTKNTRRDIRIAERHGVEVFEATTEDELRDAYVLIEDISREQGFDARAWEDFGQTLIDQVNKRQGVMLVARHGNRNLGANYSLLAGRRYNYVMGGTKRTTPDLCVGRFLHWTAINKAKELGMLGYDLASGGGRHSGIRQFKMGFRPTNVEFTAPQHYVFSHWRYTAFTKIYPLLLKHKRAMSRAMSIAHKLGIQQLSAALLLSLPQWSLLWTWIIDSPSPI